jgi:hypothetical protein
MPLDRSGFLRTPDLVYTKKVIDPSRPELMITEPLMVQEMPTSSPLRIQYTLET